LSAISLNSGIPSPPKLGERERTASFLSRLAEYQQLQQLYVMTSSKTFQVFTDIGDRSHAEV